MFRSAWFWTLCLLLGQGCALEVGNDEAALSQGEELGEIEQAAVGGGYVPLVAETAWRAVSGAVDLTGSLATIGAKGRLYAFSRDTGAGRLLKVTSIGAGGASITGTVGASPSLAADGPAVAYDEAGGRVFVAVRDTQGRVAVADGIANTLGISSWTWKLNLGSTDGAPSLVVGCNKLHLAVRSAQRTWVTSRALSGGAWAPWRAIVDSPSLPAMAASSTGVVGVAVRSFGTGGPVTFQQRTCGGTQDGTWSTPVTIGDRATPDLKVSVTAYGPLFAIALRGSGDNYPYFIHQVFGLLGPVWPSRYELVEASPKSPRVTIADAPVVTTFRGLTVLSARDANSAAYYFIRDPNSLAARTPWTGGRVIGGANFAATSVTFATAGSYTLQGPFAMQTKVPSDLYAVVLGGDGRIWLNNLSRFASIDVLENLYNMVIETGYKDGGIDKRLVDNLFENLQVFMHIPAKYRDGFSNLTADPAPSVNTSCNASLGKGMYIYPAAMGGEYVVGCGPDANNGNYYTYSGAVVNDSGTAWRLFEEWGHRVIDYNWSRFSTRSDYGPLFGDLALHTCGGLAFCIAPLACRATSYAGLPSTVCETRDGAGYRPRGFTDEYAATSTEHDWIYVALMFRWFGQDLRDMARADAAAGDTRLQRKYDALKVSYDGVEFLGRRSAAADARTSDETRGEYAMPML